MGCRLLRTWLLRPLTALEPIRDRLDAVEELAVKTTERGKGRETLRSLVESFGDVLAVLQQQGRRARQGRDEGEHPVHDGDGQALR